MAAYMTAAYSLYHNMTKIVRENGGEVYPISPDIPNPGDQS